MNPKILTFLNTHRVCSLTTLLKDGSPHASALHYSHQNSPLELYFSTENTSRKCQALLDGKSIGAAVVIGLSEEEWVTFQLDGQIQTVFEPAELKSVQAIHYIKHPDSAKYKDAPTTIFLKFTPTWWRYTDFTTKPETIISTPSPVLPG